MYTLWGVISGIFKWCWYFLGFIREFIFNLFLIIIILISIDIYLQTYHSTPVASKGALLIDLAGTIVDKPTVRVNTKFRQLNRKLFGVSSNRLQENSLFDIVDILRQAKNDNNITGIVLSLKDFIGTDQTYLQYIGKALWEFRNSGKPIYAIGDNYSQAQYFLASFANKIYLTPYGTVELHGFATHNLYYKSLLDKLKVNSHIFRVGNYKSAVEPFIRDNMSDAARDADGRWVNQLWQQYLDIVATNRHITSQQLFPGAKKILAGLRATNGDTAQFALNNKLVDSVASRSDIENDMTKAFGWNKQERNINAISIYDYQLIPPVVNGGKIAIIFANGVIIDGPETPGSVGSSHAVSQIRNARLDPEIKAIILRVNSPGGSVTASELIRSELAAVRIAGKPVVISMGGLAASGGYWISTPANTIIASSSTLTGSIGVFGIINTIEKSLNTIGVHTDGVTTSPLADISITKTLPIELSEIIQLNVENSYKNFINLVAISRHKTPEEIDKIGQGHIWIGTDALTNGLIDQLGDFDDAVIKAAELAKLKQYKLEWYMDELGILDMIISHISTSVYTMIPSIMRAWLPVIVSPATNPLKIDAGLDLGWNDPQNLYALCLLCSQTQ